jgi:integrase-like protein
MDAYSRLIVGWSIAERMRTELVTDALGMAIIRRPPDKRRDDERTILRSDHGCRYTSWAFGQRMRAAGLLASMGTVGDCYDNAMMESFWGTMQLELLDAKAWRTRDELANAIVEWIECWYNLIKTPFQYRNVQSRHLRDPPHQVRPGSLIPHRRCPCYGGNLSPIRPRAATLHFGVASFRSPGPGPGAAVSSG